MTEFIKNNTFTTAHVATEVVCLVGLLYYTIQSNRQLNKNAQSLEIRLKNCENMIQQQNAKINQLQQQQPMLQPSSYQKQQPKPKPNPVYNQKTTPVYNQQYFSPGPNKLPVIYEEPTPTISQYDDDTGISGISEEELDNEINEELGKLVDFATEA
jgi:hypothetical protein